ncbi:MAG TPA: ABC transporter permease [Myxococcales bacterium]|nr:ABC transporter permease [Myxococcales bacterium]
MSGLLRIAYKLLTNDRGKFVALLLGITFSVFLMLQMTSMFSGIMRKASSMVANTGAPVWVMDPAVTNVTAAIPMPDYVLDAVRSLPGVRFAVPLYMGMGLARLKSGLYQPVMVIGLDDTSLYGRPALIEGKIEDIYAENGFVVVKDEDYSKLESPKMGTEFEINDNRGVIVGIAKVPASGLFGLPTLYTTFERAEQYIPSMRYTIAYLLVQPKTPADVPAIQSAVRALSYEAITDQQFEAKISRWYMFHTGMGTNLLIMTAIAFIVGLSISGQTFYTFVLENLEKFGALKAIGAKGYELVEMILFQVSATALAGYGLGVGFCSALIALAKSRVPDYASVITYENLALAFGMVLVIAAISGYVAVQRVLRIEPFDIFRS